MTNPREPLAGRAAGDKIKFTSTTVDAELRFQVSLQASKCTILQYKGLHVCTVKLWCCEIATLPLAVKQVTASGVWAEFIDENGPEASLLESEREASAASKEIDVMNVARHKNTFELFQG
jgi:hypothetical protein